MKHLLALTLLIATFPVMAQQEGLSSYLPASGVIRGRIMVLSASEELEALSARMETAIQQDLQWFEEYVGQFEELDGPLPYHPRIGLSENEYNLMLRLIDDDLTLREVGSIAMTVDSGTPGRITLLAENEEFPLHNASLFHAGGYAELPFGRLDVQTTINQQDADSPTGRWTGVQWTHDEISRDGGWRALLAIGHRTDAGDGILYLDVVDNTSDDPLAFSFIVLYDL